MIAYSSTSKDHKTTESVHSPEGPQTV